MVSALYAIDYSVMGRSCFLCLNSLTPCFTFTFHLLGPYLDPYCGLHDSFWCHVCKDLESARHLQERKDEEKGELL